jgi:hypothetical protein
MLKKAAFWSQRVSGFIREHTVIVKADVLATKLLEVFEERGLRTQITVQAVKVAKRRLRTTAECACLAAD